MAEWKKGAVGNKFFRFKKQRDSRKSGW